MEELRRALAFQGDRSRAWAGVKAAPADSYPHCARAHRLSKARSWLLLLVRNGEQPRAAGDQCCGSGQTGDQCCGSGQTGLSRQERLSAHGDKLSLCWDPCPPQPQADSEVRRSVACVALRRPPLSCTDHPSSRPLSSRHPECLLLPLLESITT